jgi:ABC-type uncharacterized transport system substrate-binding protein
LLYLQCARKTGCDARPCCSARPCRQESAKHAPPAASQVHPIAGSKADSGGRAPLCRVALLSFGLLPRSARAQGRRRRIAFLGISSATEYAPLLGAFIDGLREQGYEEGKNLVIDYRWAEGRQERLPELAAELVRLEPEVIVTHATGVPAVQRATTTIPIVMGSAPTRSGKA